MNTLLLTGIAIFAGTISGKIFQRFKIPQVVGYIILGVLIGKSFLHLFEGGVVESLTPLVNFTLGVIGCVIGAELKGEIFKKFGRSIYAILVGEGVLAFIAVTILVTWVTKKLYLGLILGAIASATDPASTINVLWEYKAKGPLTRTLTSIVALDDGLALIIYGFVSVFSKTMINNLQFSWWNGLAAPVLEIVYCLVLGGLSAVIVVKVLEYIKEEALVLSFVLGVIAFSVGLATHLKLDLILYNMAFGMTIANVVPKISEKLFGAIRAMTTPLYILFFVVVGAKLDIHIFLNGAILAIVVAYLIARSAGKIAGAMAGGWLTKAKKEVTAYTGLCLFTQGGVAMGLALSISHNLSELGPSGDQAGLLVVNVVAATTFVVQLIGPPLVKFGIMKADEAHRNVTKEDILDALKVGDVMSTTFTAIPGHAHLNEVLRVVKEEDVYHFPVVGANNRFFGLITMKELKDALLEEDVNDLILAEDIASPSRQMLLAGDSLTKAYDIFHQRNLEFLPVVEDEENRKIIGIVDYPSLKETVNRKLLERHNGAEKEAGV